MHLHLEEKVQTMPSEDKTSKFQKTSLEIIDRDYRNFFLANLLLIGRNLRSLPSYFLKISQH